MVVLLDCRLEGGGMKKNRQTKKAANAAVTDYENAPVTFDANDRAEMLEAAKQFCKDSGVRPTPARIRQVILDEHGEAVANAVCDPKTSHAKAVAALAKPTVKTLQEEVNKTVSKMKKNAKAKPAAKAKKTVREILGFSVAAVARAFGKAGFKPSEAVTAIHKHQPDASTAAIRTYVQAGRHGLRGDAAKLSKKQLKELAA
jgi:hypothetical protein